MSCGQVGIAGCDFDFGAAKGGFHCGERHIVHVFLRQSQGRRCFDKSECAAGSLQAMQNVLVGNLVGDGPRGYQRSRQFAFKLCKQSGEGRCTEQLPQMEDPIVIDRRRHSFGIGPNFHRPEIPHGHRRAIAPS